MSTIFSLVVYIKNYIKELRDNMVFTPFLPTLHHSNPLYNIRTDLQCGRVNNTKSSLKHPLL